MLSAPRGQHRGGVADQTTAEGAVVEHCPGYLRYDAPSQRGQVDALRGERCTACVARFVLVDVAASVGVLADSHAALIAGEASRDERGSIDALTPRENRYAECREVPAREHQLKNFCVAVVATPNRGQIEPERLWADLDRCRGKTVEGSLPAGAVGKPTKLRAKNGHKRQCDPVDAHPFRRTRDRGEAGGKGRRVRSVGVKVRRDDCTGSVINLELQGPGDDRVQHERTLQILGRVALGPSERHVRRPRIIGS